MQRVHDSWLAAEGAMERGGDKRAVMDAFLAAVVDSFDKNDPLRYGSLQMFGFLIHAEKYKLTEQDKSLLEEQLLNNEEEPTLYRAHASYVLANYSLHQAGNYGIVYYQRILNLCNETSFEERRNIVLRRFTPDDFEGVECLVGEILDGLRAFAEEAIEFQHDECITKFTGLQRELGVEQFKNIVLPRQGPNGLKPKALRHDPPAITSTVIEQVKGLPDKDTALLIICDEKLATFFSEGPKHCFKAFTVNLDNFHSGKRAKVFTQIQVLYCDPTQSPQKNLLSTFVLACLMPYGFSPNKPLDHPAARPRKVLLRGGVSLEDPQVRLFLSMMGCTQVEVADPALLTLLTETWDGVMVETTRYACPDSPHINDYSRGIKCGNCGLYGPKLQGCPCGKTYYCSTQCQNAKWEEHKSEHKSAIARKKAKKKKK
jgi:hypothetical protein